jgi:hypothetical protein
MDYNNSEQPGRPGGGQPFVTSTAKFIAMSLCTFGVYELYWSYKNWRYVRDRDMTDIRPFWRAIFYPVWHYSLLSELNKVVRSRALESAVYRVFLASSLILLGAMWRLPDPFWLVSMLTFLPFLPAVAPMAEAVSSGPIQQPVVFHRPANLIAYLIGGPALVFVALSSIGFFPSTAVVAGSDLWDRDIVYLKEAEILGRDEEIVYFYSAGLWSVKEDGQFVSKDYVTSYWQDPADGEIGIAYASYEEIEDIKVAWAKGSWDQTVITVITNEEAEFELWLSSESGGDRKFVDTMRRFWKLSERSPVVDP